MIIKSNADVVEKMLLLHNFTIDIYTDDVESLINELKKIDIEIYTEPSFDKTMKVYSIHPVPKSFELNYYIVRSEHKPQSDWMRKTVVILDFVYSNEFYDLFGIRQSQHKILSDKYSYNRAKILYPFLADFENELRSWYLMQFGHDIIPKNSRAIDHPISQMQLGELLSDYLLKPASDKYFFEMLNKARDDNEKFWVRSLTRLDEMSSSFSSEDFKNFFKIRNAVMHFKVVKVEEVRFALEFVSKFKHERFTRLILDNVIEQ